jgi:hypothetical protein
MNGAAEPGNRSRSCAREKENRAAAKTEIFQNETKDESSHDHENQNIFSIKMSKIHTQSRM